MLLLDCGIELKIEIGEGTEALEGMYFRTRVLKNEYVNKGKLILEYDVEKLKAAGYDPGIRMQILNPLQEEGVEYVLAKEENGFGEAADSEKNQEIGERSGRRRKVKVGKKSIQVNCNAEYDKKRVDKYPTGVILHDNGRNTP